jgi:hypothetical protein
LEEKSSATISTFVDIGEDTGGEVDRVGGHDGSPGVGGNSPVMLGLRDAPIVYLK